MSQPTTGTSSTTAFTGQRFLTALEHHGALLPDHVRVVLGKGDLTPQQAQDFVCSRTTVASAVVARAYADALRLPFYDLNWSPSDPTLLSFLPINDWRRHRAFPVARYDSTLEIVLADPFDARFTLLLEGKTGLRIARHVGMGEQIDEYLAMSVVEAAGVQESLKGISGDQLLVMARQLEVGEISGLIPLGESIVALALKMKASDIHIEPLEHEARIRFRIDGDLTEVLVIGLRVAAALVGYFKVASHLDIAERRLPQDGHMHGGSGLGRIDMRLSTVPTVHGEKLVIRLLAKPSSLRLDDLGFPPAMLARYRALLEAPYGFFLVTGPTGSGKTTTLYATLREISSPALNVTTIEDPVEYRLGGINQVQIHGKIGLDFARVMRSCLRQDPDIILVGEIRDSESAHIAVQAALTGHMVLSTLHTNTAPEAVVRLVDMGVPTYLVAQALLGVMAQRLVRRLCPYCRRKEVASPAVLERLAAPKVNEPLAFFQPVGCPRCSFRGYLGRVAVSELLVLDDHLRDAVSRGQRVRDWREIAEKMGYRPLAFDALAKALAGEITVEEALRHQMRQDWS